MKTHKKYIAIHKKLSGIYTHEEYLKFSDMVPKEDSIKRRLNNYLKKGKLFTRINSSKGHFNNLIWNSFSEYLYHNYYALYIVMYQVKLEDLPLFLGRSMGVVHIAILWRFKIGK